MKKENKSNKKTIYMVIGLLLVIGTLFGGNLKYLGDWSTMELIGYNGWTLVAIFGGGYLVYIGAKK